MGIQYRNCQRNCKRSITKKWQKVQNGTFVKVCDDILGTDNVGQLLLACRSGDLQPHYGNGVFGNLHLLALDNTKR